MVNYIKGLIKMDIPEHINRLMRILHRSRTDRKSYFGIRWQNIYSDMCLKVSLKWIKELDDELREHYLKEIKEEIRVKTGVKLR